MNYDTLMAKARKHNARLDAMDRKAGNANPAQCPPIQTIRTAMEAIRCGIAIDDWDCVAQGQAILEELCSRGE